MKSEDFDRLKAVCEKEVFIVSSNIQETGKLFYIEKKDIWEGVEFAEIMNNYEGNHYTIGKIYPITKKDLKSIYTLYDDKFNSDNGLDFYMVKPSTESAYIEQLKAECFKRFGEIKEGDEFDRGLIGYGKGSINFIPNGGYEKGFNYSKESDALYFDNLLIYEKGKWATIVKERVKVESKIYNWSGEPVSGYNFKFEFRVKNAGYNTDLKYLSELLASKLEEYLNKE